MKILFHSNGLGLRGTEVALFDYARYNEEMLGNESVIVSSANGELSAINKFRHRFKVELYVHPGQIDDICLRNNVDIFYAIKLGLMDGIVSNICKTVIHVVFGVFEPHGNVYAYVSQWLTNMVTGGRFPYVPHIVTLPSIQDDLRDKLNIPQKAKVFGFLGGADSFNIPFVHKAVYDVAQRYGKIFFVFMNIAEFCGPLPNIIHLPGTFDLDMKTAFINTCDAMLHARDRGETFGLSIAEFSIKNKPVITWINSPERCHIEILRESGIYYEGYNDLVDILVNYDIDKSKCWDKYSSEFSPEKVMLKFKEVFVDGIC
jgi:hypothetical protein